MKKLNLKKINDCFDVLEVVGQGHGLKLTSHPSYVQWKQCPIYHSSVCPPPAGHLLCVVFPWCWEVWMLHRESRSWPRSHQPKSYCLDSPRSQVAWFSSLFPPSLWGNRLCALEGGLVGCNRLHPSDGQNWPKNWQQSLSPSLVPGRPPQASPLCFLQSCFVSMIRMRTVSWTKR